MHSVVRKLMALTVALAAAFASPATFALDTGDIVVTSIKGEVHVVMNGTERTVRAGGVLELPATIKTGRDGAIDLRQGATTVSVGPETQLEFPALEKRGGPIDKIVQPRGNAFYSIGKREGRRLRVETPYLVAVIKGTQFNVVAQDESTTISLFEGLLEVRARDDNDVVDIKAGEIAARTRGEQSISVLKMDAKAPPTQRAPTSGGSANGGAPAPAPRSKVKAGESVLANRGIGTHPVEAVSSDTAASIESRTEAGGAAAAVSVTIDSANPDAVDAGVGAGANVGSSGGAATAGVAVVDAGATVNVGAAAVDTGVNLGAADVGANAAVNSGATGVDVTAHSNVDVGTATAATGTAAAVDFGASNVANVDLGAAANAGNPASVDASANAGVNLGASSVATNVDVGANVAGLAAGASAAVSVATGNVDLGVTIAGADLGVGLNLGVDDGNNGNGNDASHSDPSNPGKGGGSTPSAPAAPTTPVVDVGDLLDGLSHRHGKK